MTKDELENWVKKQENKKSLQDKDNEFLDSKPLLKPSYQLWEVEE